MRQLSKLPIVRNNIRSLVLLALPYWLVGDADLASCDCGGLKWLCFAALLPSSPSVGQPSSTFDPTMATPASAALLLLASLAVCASARTVPQQGSLWSHLMRAWSPRSSGKQHSKPLLAGHAAYDEATGSFTFTKEAPHNGEMVIIYRRECPRTHGVSFQVTSRGGGIRFCNARCRCSACSRQLFSLE
jgi:hypothetical protein